MNNFFKTTMYITAFALAGIFFQISCSNSDEATERPSNSAQINSSGNIVYVVLSGSTNGLMQSIWKCNLDGSDPTQIPITLPTGTKLASYASTYEHTKVRLTPDGSGIVFMTQTPSGGFTYYSLYKCDLNGQNLQELVTGQLDEPLFLEDIK